MKRDSLDFEKEPVGRLFHSMFLPTLMGMVSMVVLNVTDGAFVGHGVGSDALAAVNIVAPLFTISAGVGMMLGIGCSVAASIHLGHHNQHAANLNLTQGILASFVIGLVVSIVVLCNQETVCRLFGCTDILMPHACSYLRWIAAAMPINMFGATAMFMVRLDGSPKFAMVINCTAAVINIFLDWLFVFPLKMGLEGAAIATSIAFSFCGVLLLIYILKYTKSVHLARIKASQKSMRLTLRNIGYQCRIGFSAFLSEIAIAAVIVVGNYAFVSRLGEDGVAAFSVACYCLPVAFMMGNAIVQSIQPIVSIAYGQDRKDRIALATRIALSTGFGAGIIALILMSVGAKLISSIFLSSTTNAFALCVEGLPIFGVAFLFTIINLVMIGYMQSTEQARQATLFTVLRGFVFSIPCFAILPPVFGDSGLWLAMPFAELITGVAIAIAWKFKAIKR